MRKNEPTIIVIRRDAESGMWVRDHYTMDGVPDSDPSGYVTVSTGLGSGEDSLFVETLTSDMFPSASVIVSPPEPNN